MRTGAQRGEVVGRLGHHVPVEAHDHAPRLLPSDGDVEEHLLGDRRVRCRLGCKRTQRKERVRCTRGQKEGGGEGGNVEKKGKARMEG